jgi:hypothetical protein
MGDDVTIQPGSDIQIATRVVRIVPNSVDPARKFILGELTDPVREVHFFLMYILEIIRKVPFTSVPVPVPKSPRGKFQALRMFLGGPGRAEFGLQTFCKALDRVKGYHGFRV